MDLGTKVSLKLNAAKLFAILISSQAYMKQTL